MSKEAPPALYPVAQLQQPVASTGVVRLPDVFPDRSFRIVCNVCKEDISTKTTESCNPICCVLFGCWALCCCQDVEHKCPNCNSLLGVHKGSDC